MKFLWMKQEATYRNFYVLETIDYWIDSFIDLLINKNYYVQY